MIPVPKNVPLTPELLQAQIAAGQNLRIIMVNKIEQWQKMQHAQAQFFKSLGESNGCHISAKAYYESIRNFAEAEMLIFNLEIQRIDGQIALAEAQLEQIRQGAGGAQIITP